MKVSLLEFVKIGCFGPVTIGASRADVFLFFSRPPDWSAECKTPDSARIWKYGDVEFYFEAGQLWMIFMDDFDVPYGKGNLELNAGPFYGGMLLDEAKQVLEDLKIAHQVECDLLSIKLNSDSGSGVTLHFNEGRQKLFAIYATK